MLVTGLASVAASVIYANVTAARQAAQSRVQDATIAQLQAQLLAACGFAADVGGAPVVTGPTGKASELSVKIVSDSRAQWRQLGCPGKLAPPEPSFTRWAAFYHLPAS